MMHLKNNRGVTLVEMLSTIIVVLLVSALVAAGVSFGTRNYRSSMAMSQAQTLRSTLTTVLSDKLRFCGTVITNEAQEVLEIFVRDIGSVEGEEQGEAFGIVDGEVLLGENKLLGSAAYPEGLKVSGLTLTYEETTEIFSVSFCITDQQDKELAKTEFQVKRINSV